MAPRRAALMAGALVLTALSASAAIGANFGLVGMAAQDTSPIGTFDPAARPVPLSTTASTVEALVSSEPAATTPAPAVSTPAVSAPASATSPRSAASRPTTTPAATHRSTRASHPTTTAPARSSDEDHHRGSARSHPEAGDDD
jgi:hypothetical protein